MTDPKTLTLEQFLAALQNAGHQLTELAANVQAALDRAAAPLPPSEPTRLNLAHREAAKPRRKPAPMAPWGCWGRDLAARRVRAGLHQKELAELAGVHYGIVARLERRTTAPHQTNVVRNAQRMEFTLSELGV